MANDWGWPFSGGYKGYEEGQQFGMTTYDRTGHGDYFHDGFDFGSAKYPGSNIAAVHAGTVVYAGWAPAGYGALGTVVVTKDSSGYYVVYQEFGTSTSNINVSVGQSVTLGQVIGTRNTSHLHLGITKKDWLSAQSSAFKDDGTWLNPINIIQNGTGTDDPDPETEEEEMIRFKVVTGGAKGSIGYLYNGRFVCGGATGDDNLIYNKLALMQSQGKIKPIQDDISGDEFNALLNKYPSFKNSK
ncbi:M23 family metallopeptidase [Lactococcus lactis]|uniref:M23 family metallopeptidase n=1 Tax=Lactococcus lactis TaxID=1358 RepID=UPI00384A9C52